MKAIHCLFALILCCTLSIGSLQAAGAMSKAAVEKEAFLDQESRLYLESQMSPAASDNPVAPAKPFGVLLLILGVGGLFLSPIAIEGFRTA